MSSTGSNSLSVLEQNKLFKPILVKSIPSFDNGFISFKAVFPLKQVIFSLRVFFGGQDAMKVTGSRLCNSGRGKFFLSRESKYITGD